MTLQDSAFMLLEVNHRLRSLIALLKKMAMLRGSWGWDATWRERPREDRPLRCAGERSHLGDFIPVKFPADPTAGYNLIPISWETQSESESLVAQSCLTLCDPVDCSLPGFSIHRIFQARVLEWVAISFPRGSSQARNQTRVSHIVDRCFTLWATREVLRDPKQSAKDRPNYIQSCP